MVETNNPLQSLQRELETRLAERAAIDQKIKAVRRSIKVLEPLYGGVRPSGVYPMSILAKGPMGITDRIREVLKANPNQALAPTRVRDLMLSFGFDIPNGPNPMATIHTILKRTRTSMSSKPKAAEVYTRTSPLRLHRRKGSERLTLMWPLSLAWNLIRW